MSQLAHAYPHFRKANAAVAMLSVDSLKRARQLAVATHAPFPVLSDVDADVTVAYNVFENGIAIASTFLIDKQGQVSWVYIAERPSDRPSVDMMLERLSLERPNES